MIENFTAESRIKVYKRLFYMDAIWHPRIPVMDTHDLPVFTRNRDQTGICNRECNDTYTGESLRTAPDLTK